MLGHEAVNWPTPNARDYKGAAGDKGPERSLPRDAKNWPTPQTNPQAPNRNTNTKHGPASLLDAAYLWLRSHLGLTIGSDGEPSSNETQASRRRLSPRFVEWLMGLPAGLTSSAQLETRSYLLWLRVHSESLPPVRWRAE